ncbi:ankyrin repeat domain-containing protein 50 [Coprinopsis cinerea okayama7|uniref:Ankyrin repeat domain-containing protein 50 n=1 Tax=Coprinopsis cinerea (strain Okayama-7 / 130 / ATCC MYA-4618 / FGSC 9003) TaxID=240176 RepID=A8NMP7_COPC7|nr:ankyrin repeat domain-containing protein 50 [Coprinopsis cinerea okayama7\|eukprot:XP_001834959.2 ankyrin repeat domain-containing protein 50 [Coprinopsis cinerea okayama7\
MGQFFETIPPWLIPWIESQKIFWVATAPLDKEGHVNVSPKGCFGRTLGVVLEGDDPLAVEGSDNEGGGGNRGQGEEDWSKLEGVSGGKFVGETSAKRHSRAVWYEDLTGSGVETIAHLRENGRITLMLTAFEGPPRVCRLFGVGKVFEFGTPEYDRLLPPQKRQPGSRAVIWIDVHRVGTSCGYSIPFFEFKAPRVRLHKFALKKEQEDVDYARACTNGNAGEDGAPGGGPDTINPNADAGATTTNGTEIGMTDKGLLAYWKTRNATSHDGLPGLDVAFTVHPGRMGDWQNDGTLEGAKWGGLVDDESVKRDVKGDDGGKEGNDRSGGSNGGRGTLQEVCRHAEATPNRGNDAEQFTLHSPRAAGGDGGKMPGTYDFENESRSMFENARNVNIHGGVFHQGDVHVQINNYTSTNSPESRPGAGKTVLARYTEPLAVTDIVKSLIKQCIERNHDLARVVEPVYEKHQLEGTEPSIDELVDLLQMLESYFNRVYYVIDGVDEAHLDVRFDLIEVINKLQGNIMLTSRPLDELGADLECAVFCELTAQDSDIQLHMEEKLQRYKQLGRVLDQSDCREEILHDIIEKAEGMFLHASLQLDAIQHCHSYESIRQKLAAFPTGITGMYAASLRRIQDQDPESRELATRILLWLTFARGPLIMRDLRYALATDPETGEFHPERMPPEESILSVCCGLVEHHTSNIVRLIHYTAQDALIPLLLEDHPQPHIPITKALIQRVLSSGILQAGFQELGQLHDAWEDEPLLRYAQEELGAHIEECSAEITTVVDDFLLRCSGFPMDIGGLFDVCQPPHVAAHYGLGSYFKSLADNGCNLDAQTQFLDHTALHLVAESGNEQAVEQLIQLNVDPNVAGIGGWTPLMRAVYDGHRAVVFQILQIPGLEVDAADSQGRTALMWAARQGHHDIISRFFQIPGINVHTADYSGSTALMLAAEQGSVDVASQLLQVPGIEVNAANDQGWTALMVAAYHGHANVVSQLAQIPGTEVNATDNEGWTALMLAVFYGHGDVVSRLLQVPAIEVNAADHTGGTALMKGAHKGHVDAVFQLLEMPGIDFNASDNQGWTALMLAVFHARDDIVSRLLKIPDIEVNAVDHAGATALMKGALQGHGDVVSQLLLIPGIEVNATSKQGWTALMSAAHGGHADVVSQLAQIPGIEVDAVDIDGCTALMLAAQQGRGDVVSRLAELSDINTANNQGWTALMWAVDRGRDDVVSRLLQIPGIAANASNKQGWTALMLAAYRGHNDVVSRLAQMPGVEINAANNEGWTALMVAARVGHNDAVSRLLQIPGIDVNATESKGGSALSIAALEGHSNVVAQLLQFPGIEVNATDNNGWTALLLAAHPGHDDVVFRLLQIPGIAVNARDSNGWTALMWSAYMGHVDVLSRLLLHPDIDPDARNHHHWTPLTLASQRGHHDIVRLLLECDGVDVNAADSIGNTSLIMASWSGHRLVVELLIQSPGIDLNLKNKRRLSALKAAQQMGHEEIVAKLIEFQQK